MNPKVVVPPFPPVSKSPLSSESKIRKPLSDPAVFSRLMANARAGFKKGLRFRSRVLWGFFAASISAQLVPVLDHALSPVLNNALLAAQPPAVPAYLFELQSRGIIRNTCRQGSSRLEVVPDRILKTDEGAFQVVKLEALLCTEFGFRKKEGMLYLPSDLFRPDSEVLHGLWETKTYTGVPSTKSPDRFLTLEVRRLSYGTEEISWLPDGFEEPEYPPVRVGLAQDDELSLIEGWRPGLIPWKSIEVEVSVPFLSKPVVLHGELTRIVQLAAPKATSSFLHFVR